MAISVSFNGATIKKPGSYSKTQIDLGGNLPLSPAGLVVIVGEADAGAPVTAEIDASKNVYTADQLAEARAKYRSGPIVDALGFLFSPAVDGAIPNGAQAVWVLKTNTSARASLALSSSYGILRAREWGVGGNQISAKITSSSESAPAVVGSAPAAFGSALNGVSFSVRKNGGALAAVTLSSTAGDHSDLVSLVAELNSELPAGVQASVSSGAVKLQLSADANQHKLGWGRSLELVDSTLGDLAKLGLAVGQSVSSSEPSITMAFSQKRDLLVEEDIVGGNVVLLVGHDGSGGVSSASVSVSDTEVVLTTSAGPVSLAKSEYTTLGLLAEAIGFQPGWSASVSNALYAQLPLSCLDHVSSVGALSEAGHKPARIKKDSFEVAKLVSESLLVQMLDQAEVGLPDLLSESMLSGGAKGATSSLSFVEALAKAEKFHCNFVVPLFSRDATADIADSLTDPTSSYTIDGIHQAVKTHISLMKTVKKRSERQGFLSLKASFDASKEKAASISDGRVQLAIQDVRQIDAAGNIKWFQPWALSCLLAGSRSGASVGLPLTFKFLNCAGIRHTSQAMTTAEQDIVMDFDPDVDFEEAIDAGITVLEAPRTGGFRVVVDNTTYGLDSNWVWNRGNVIYAGDIVSYNFRNAMELRYVGVKNTIRAAEVKSTAESILSTFLSQGVTVSTSDAPQGYKNLSVRIEGNTIFISVAIKLVEGVDFILSEITVQRAAQTA
jgi:hypothetical protein